MFLFCTYYGKPEEKVIREISDFLPEPMGKKESFILSLLFSLDNDMRTWPGGGSFRLPGIVFCTNAVYIVYIYCLQLLYIGNFGEYEKVALYKLSHNKIGVCDHN